MSKNHMEEVAKMLGGGTGRRLPYKGNPFRPFV